MHSGTRGTAAGAVAAAAVFLAWAAAGVAGQAQGGCTLTLYLNASASTVSMAGSAVVLPIQQALVPAYPEALVGFEGSLALVLPSGPCPSSAAGLEQQLAGATLQTTNATGPLQLYPAESIEVSGCGTLLRDGTDAASSERSDASSLPPSTLNHPHHPCSSTV